MGTIAPYKLPIESGKCYVHLNMARYVLRNKKCDCNLLNNRFLKKKSITMGNDIETSELL